MNELKARGKTQRSLFEITDEGVKTHYLRLSEEWGKSITAHALRRGYTVISRKMQIPDTIIMQNAGWVNPKMLFTYSKPLGLTQANEIYNQFSESIKEMLGLKDISPPLITLR